MVEFNELRSLEFERPKTPLPTPDPTAKIIPAPDFISPYTDLGEAGKEAYVTQFEPPTLPKLEEPESQ